MTKLERISKELESVAERINKMQERKRELERQKLEAEKGEIVEMVFSAQISREELANLIKKRNDIGIGKLESLEGLINEQRS